MASTIQKSRQYRRPGRWRKQLLYLGIVAFIFPLIFYASVGSYSRYQADDYCTAANLKEEGFFQGQATFFRTETWRYTYTLVTSISHLFDLTGARALPGITLIGILFATYWVILQIFLRWRLHSPRLTAFLAAAMITFFSIYLLPNRFQNLYWQSALVTYTIPVVFWMVMAGIILTNWDHTRAHFIYNIIGFFLLAFFTGGFSETGLAMQIGALGLAFLAALFQPNNRSTRLSILIAGLLGSLVSLAVMRLLPSEGLLIRQATLPPAPDLVTLVTQSFLFAWDFISQSILGKPLPYFLLVFISLLFGYVLFEYSDQPIKSQVDEKTETGHNSVSNSTAETAIVNSEKNLEESNEKGNKEKDASPVQSLPFQRVVINLLIIPILTYLLIVCICAPSMYAESAYPSGRVLGLGVFVLVIAILLWGFLAGLAISRLPRHKTIVSIAGFLLMISLMYPIRAGLLAQLEIADAENYAIQWDARDATIRQAATNGQTSITIPGFPARYEVADYGIDPTFWVNRCAAAYYGLQEIKGK
jgi:hypothetical protein